MNNQIQEASNETNLIQEMSLLPKTRIPLDKIKPRANGDFREIDQENVNNLKANIKFSGFTSTIFIDRNDRLIGGMHRLEALKQLRSEGWGGVPEIGDMVSYDSIPCTSHAIDSTIDVDKAILLEISENSVRKELSKEEIEKAIQVLMGMGYKHCENRPKKEDVTINMMLVDMFKMSPATASRHVKGYNLKMGRNGGIVLKGVNLKDDGDDSNLEVSRRGRPPKNDAPISNPFITETDGDVVSKNQSQPDQKPMGEALTSEPSTEANRAKPTNESDVDPLENLGRTLIETMNRYELKISRKKNEDSSLNITVDSREFQIVRKIAQGWMQGLTIAVEDAEKQCA